MVENATIKKNFLGAEKQDFIIIFGPKALLNFGVFVRKKSLGC